MQIHITDFIHTAIVFSFLSPRASGTKLRASAFHSGQLKHEKNTRNAKVMTPICHEFEAIIVMLYVMISKQL